MGHIFISYSHKDKEYVHKLQEALLEKGFDAWVDDRIDYGTEWPKVVQDKLDGCDGFIVVVSENAYESTWVQNEVARAGRKGKPFFPLLLQGDPWLSVEATQYVNVTGGTLPPEKFYERLGTVTQRRGHRGIRGRKSEASTIQIRSMADITPGTIRDLNLLFSDWASTATTKKDVLRKLGLLARSSTSKVDLRMIADLVARTLYDKDIGVRNMAKAILAEIGAPSIEPIMNIELDRIPGRQRGRWVAMDIFGSMGVKAIPHLVAAANKHKNGHIIVDVLCYRMPIEDTIDALKDFFLQESLDSRQRETVYHKLTGYPNWYASELEEFLKKGLGHPDPLVRVLSSKWLVAAFPADARLALKDLQKDDALVEYNYGEQSVATLVSEVLSKIPK